MGEDDAGNVVRDLGHDPIGIKFCHRFMAKADEGESCAAGIADFVPENGDSGLGEGVGDARSAVGVEEVVVAEDGVGPVATVERSQFLGEGLNGFGAVGDVVAGEENEVGIVAVTGGDRLVEELF